MAPEAYWSQRNWKEVGSHEMMSKGGGTNVTTYTEVRILCHRALPERDSELRAANYTLIRLRVGPDAGDLQGPEEATNSICQGRRGGSVRRLFGK